MSSLDKRLKAATTVVVIVFLLASAIVLWLQWHVYWSARQALAEMRTFRTTLITMEKLSAERGPTNGALGEPLPLSPEREAALRRVRGDTNLMIQQLSAQLDSADCKGCEQTVQMLDQAIAGLVRARCNTDRLLALPRQQRSQQALDDATHRMFALLPQVEPIANAFSLQIATADAADVLLVRYLNLAYLAEILRDQAGRLGSHLTGSLGSRRPLTYEQELAIAASYGRLDQLRASILALGARTPPQAQQALQTMQEAYFDYAYAYVEQIRALAAAGSPAAPTTAQFAARYVPLMGPIVRFRDAMLDLAQQNLEARKNVLLARLCATIAAFVALTALLFALVRQFRRRVIAPLARATAQIVAVADGDYAAEPAPPAAEAYDGEIRTLFEAIHTLQVNSGERARAIEYASLIQRSMQPRDRLDAWFGTQYAILWQPRDVVGGDFYYCRPHADGLLIGVGDCAGHGVPGALLTMIARGAIDQALDALPEHPPAALLARIDENVRRLFEHAQLSRLIESNLDLGLIQIDRERRRIRFAGAGLTLYASDGEDVREYRGARAPLGDKRSAVFENLDLTLEPGWTYYLPSDGLLDQSGGDAGFGFGRTRFAEMLRAHARAPLDRQIAAFRATLAQYQGPHAQRDDITLFAFRGAGDHGE